VFYSRHGFWALDLAPKEHVHRAAAAIALGLDFIQAADERGMIC
jgi:hypothetical protein